LGDLIERKNFGFVITEELPIQGDGMDTIGMKHREREIGGKPWFTALTDIAEITGAGISVGGIHHASTNADSGGCSAAGEATQFEAVVAFDVTDLECLAFRESAAFSALSDAEAAQKNTTTDNQLILL